MNDNERSRVAIPYLLMMIFGCFVVICIYVKVTYLLLGIGILALTIGGFGLFWACDSRDGFVSSEEKIKRNMRRTHLDHLPVVVPVELEIVDDIKQAVADGWTITKNWQVP